MRTNILIVGQGLAGTLLGWELERAGIAFAVADGGHERSASFAGAGIINPITGRRLVKSWRIDEWLPLARDAYAAMEQALGVRLWHERRVWRKFADDGEREVFAKKQARGEFAPFARCDSARGDGFWIDRAAWVDVATLLRAMRARWQSRGWLRAERVSLEEALRAHALVIDCRGVAGAQGEAFSFVPWEFSKGELLELRVDGLEPEVILNARQWVLPIAPGAAWVGATHEPGKTDAVATAAAAESLRDAAAALLGRELTVIGQRAGVRVTLRDKHPVAGRHPRIAQLGVVNALGSKGALWAPVLARQWAAHLTRGARFDREIDVARFA